MFCVLLGQITISNTRNNFHVSFSLKIIYYTTIITITCKIMMYYTVVMAEW